MEVRMSAVYAGLEKNQLFTKDQKIPFQWIQAGNTGNTPGQGNKPHGTSTWTPGPNGTVITADPAPNWDDFIFYSVLPYPATPPTKLRATAGNWSALTPQDWFKAQQIEGPQLEWIGGGFKYTCCLAVNHDVGLQYWAGAKKWQPLGNVVVSLANPTFWQFECTIDAQRHVLRYDWLVANDKEAGISIEVPAVAAPPQRKELSVAVQMDGNKAGDAYSCLLNNLVVEWE
jgi:hypothetical protein